MTALPESFKFEDGFPAPVGCLEVVIPPGLSSKAEVLATLQAGLKMPDYFASNWDSFEECITDLEWIPSPTVLLRHLGVPFRDDASNARIYWDILKSACHRFESENGKSLIVALPTGARGQLEALLADASPTPDSERQAPRG